MSQDYRIKEYRFPSFLFITGVSAAVTQTTNHAINGEILDIEWTSDSTGSLAVALSGTAFEVFRRNAPSGTGWQQTFPRIFSQTTTGSIANALHVPWVVNEPMVVSMTAASGTTALSGTSYAVTIRYR